MPGGIPVASMGIGSSGAKNAVLFAVEILALENSALREKLKDHRKQMQEKVVKDNLNLTKSGWRKMAKK